MPTTTCLILHNGLGLPQTPDNPALAFIRRYVRKVDSSDLSTPFYDWYSQSCQFYNADGTVYDGGENIWTWMRSLFGVFRTVKHEIHTVRLFKATKDEFDPERDANWVWLETTTSFTPKAWEEQRDPIKVPRLLAFMVGVSEVQGQGTGGLQILAAKVWWDTAVLERQMSKKGD